MRFGLLLLVFFVFSGLRPQQAPPVQEPAALKQLFSRYKVQGSFLLFDAQRNAYTAYNYQRCQQGFLPASTFKILNTLIGLQTGVLQNEQSVMRWDGVQRDNPNWNHDQSVTNAFRVSCVPCYQDLARRIGLKRMQHWVKQARYGHLDIRPDNLDSFWLRGRSRITPLEQVDFLRRVYTGKVPFDKRHLATLKKVMLLDAQPDYRLYAKTGLTANEHPDVGWFVGYVERNDKVYFFTTNLESPEPQPASFINDRRRLTEDILHELGVKP